MEQITFQNEWSQEKQEVVTSWHLNSTFQIAMENTSTKKSSTQTKPDQGLHTHLELVEREGGRWAEKDLQNRIIRSPFALIPIMILKD